MKSEWQTVRAHLELSRRMPIIGPPLMQSPRRHALGQGQMRVVGRGASHTDLGRLHGWARINHLLPPERKDNARDVPSPPSFSLVKVNAVSDAMHGRTVNHPPVLVPEFRIRGSIVWR